MRQCLAARRHRGSPADRRHRDRRIINDPVHDHVRHIAVDRHPSAANTASFHATSPSRANASPLPCTRTS